MDKEQKDKVKIMHGITERAGQAIYSTKGLRENGCDATLVLWSESANQYPYDKCLMIDKKKKWLYPLYGLKIFFNFLQCAFTYDIFHFHSGHSLLPRNKDLWFLKKLKKKVFFEFHGSELRSQIYDIFYTYEPRPEDREKQAKQLLKLPKYTDGFILHDEELVPHLPKCDVPVYIVPLRVDLDQFEPEYPVAEKENPIIVHAPSLRSGKGTDNILKVLDQLDAEFTLELVEGKTQQEAFAIYKTADIVIDQISVGSYGVFAIEAMALGKPVITYISDDMRKTFPENLPIVSAIPETLGAKLKKLIENGDYRSTLGKAGRVYVEGYHDYVKNGRLLKDIYEGKGSPIEQR